MRVIITAIDFDPEGVIEINALPDSTFGDIRRRTNRTATLDGGAAFNDFGYSEADRTIEIKWTPMSRAKEQAIARLVAMYSRVRVAAVQGCFIVAPERYQPGTDESSLTLLVVSKTA